MRNPTQFLKSRPWLCCFG